MQVSNPLPINLPSLGLVRIGDWTDAAAVFRREHVPGTGLVLSPYRPTFDISGGRTVGAADSEYGWTWQNRAKVSAANEGTTLAGATTITATSTSSDFNISGARSAIMRYKTIPFPASGGSFFCRLSHTTSGRGGIFMMLGSDAQYASTLGMSNTTGLLFRTMRTTSTDVEVTGTPIVDGAGWLRMDIHAGAIQAWYAADAASVPSVWTHFGTHSHSWVYATTSAESLLYGNYISNPSGVANIVTTIKYFDDRHMDPDGNRSVDYGQLWGATKLETSGYTITAAISCAPNAVLSDATLRAALSAAIVDANPFDTTGWTMRAKRGGAPSGAYAAVSSLVQEATAGSGLYLDLKYTSSDGIKRGALRDLYVPLAAL